MHFLALLFQLHLPSLSVFTSKLSFCSTLVVFAVVLIAIGHYCIQNRKTAVKLLNSGVG